MKPFYYNGHETSEQILQNLVFNRMRAKQSSAQDPSAEEKSNGLALYVTDDRYNQSVTFNNRAADVCLGRVPKHTANWAITEDEAGSPSLSKVHKVVNNDLEFMAFHAEVDKTYPGAKIEIVGVVRDDADVFAYLSPPPGVVMGSQFKRFDFTTEYCHSDRDKAAENEDNSGLVVISEKMLERAKTWPYPLQNLNGPGDIIKMPVLDKKMALLACEVLLPLRAQERAAKEALQNKVSFQYQLVENGKAITALPEDKRDKLTIVQTVELELAAQGAEITKVPSIKVPPTDNARRLTQ